MDSKATLDLQKRPIDQRYVPPVVGKDLEHALNYINLADVDEDFIYNKYTSSIPVYRTGSRPKLEEIAQDLTDKHRSSIDKVRALTEFVAKKVAWSGYFLKITGQSLPTDRGLTEEELIESGFGWCHEQTRVLCALTQVIGIPSRMVFANNKKMNSGHVVAEVFLCDDWMLVDQTLNCCFAMDDKPIRAVDILSSDIFMKYCDCLYRDCCDKVKQDIGAEKFKCRRPWFLSEDPIMLFGDLGFCNYFIL